MKSIKVVTLVLSALTFLCASPAFGQSDRGSLTGTITDPSGAVVANARVTATNLNTGEARDTTTTDEGVYRLPELKADPYRITVEAQGFKTATIEDVQIAVQVTRRADVQLETGAITESVTVSSDTSVLQTDTPVVQTNITERQVRELPLQIGSEVAGRSPLAFVFLDSSVTSTTNADPDQGGSTSNPTSTSRFRVNGGQGLGAEILVDGASVRRSQNGTEFSVVGPGPNAFQEFTISTNSFSAEFGNTSGGVINFTTKSGGNEFHGEAYLFFRDEALDANGFFRNASGLRRDPLQQKDYGFNVGGPIYLPRFGEGGPAYVSGKNRAFFFFNYNGFRFQETEVVNISVPTERMRQGDFGELLTDPYVLQFFNGPVRIYDPTAPPGSRPVIPNNDLRTYRNAAGQSVIDPIGFNIAQFFPQPTRPGVFHNYTAVSTRPENTNNLTAKLDFVATANHRLNGSYSFRNQDRLIGFTRFPGTIPAGGVFEQPFRSDIVRIQDNYTITETLLNHFNFGFTRYFTPNRNLTEGFDPRSLGFSERATQNRAFPLIGIPGYGDPVRSGDPRAYQGIGSSFFSDTLRDRAFEFSDFMTYVRGRHSMRFGGTLRFQNFNVQQLIHPGGEFNFRAPQTSQNGENNGGWPIASLLTGATEFSFNSIQGLAPTYRQFTQAYFFQDDIKVTPQLTLNLGIRYDLPGLRTEEQNRFRTFDPNAANPAAGGRLGALVNAGGSDGGIPAQYETLARPDRSNIGPRLGFAYAFNDRTVVRGGIGMYYAPILYGFGGRNTLTEGTIGYNSPVGPNINGGADANPDLFLRNYRSRVDLSPTGQYLGLDVDYFDPNFRTGRTVQYSIDFQRQLPYNFAIQIGYNGNRGTRLRSNFGRVNALPFNAIRLGREILDAPLSRITNPGPGDIAFANAARSLAQTVGVALPTSNNAVFPGYNGSVANALRPFPQYRDIRNQLESQGRSDYNSLQVKLDRRFTQGIQFGLSYTFSRLRTDASEDLFGDNLLGGVLQSPYLPRERAISPNDVPHAVVFNYIFELPFGKGKRFLNGGGIVDKLFGGFQLNAIHRYQSGLPFRVLQTNSGGFLSPDVTGFGGSLRPSLTGQPIATGNEPGGIRYQFANPAAFSLTPLAFGPPLLVNGQLNPAYAAFFNDPNVFFGTAPAVFPDVRLPAFLSENVGLLKRTRITETVSVELGIEAFNVFNRKRYLFPITDVNFGFNPSAITGFGTAEIDPNSRRTVQLRARLTF